jgi:hypothetical protein
MTHATNHAGKPSADRTGDEGPITAPLSVVGTHSTQPGLTGDGTASPAGFESSSDGQNSGGTAA